MTIVFKTLLSLTNLLGEDVVGEGSHAGGVGDEVGHRLHDVPRVHPPGEPGQSATLHWQQGQAAPHHPGALGIGRLGQLGPHLKSKGTQVGVAGGGAAVMCDSYVFLFIRWMNVFYSFLFCSDAAVIDVTVGIHLANVLISVW